MMSNDKFTFAEQKLIARLQNAPQKELANATIEAIHNKILLAVGTPVPRSDVPAKASITKLPIYIIVASGVAIVVVLSIVVILFSGMTSNVNNEADATVVPNMSETPEPISASPNPEKATPTPLQTEVPVIVVIEGPVSAIQANIITVFEVDVQVDETHPVYNQIQIGDTLHIVGEAIISGNTVIIIAIDIVIQEIESPSIELPPNCKRTTKGKITCK